MHAARTPSRCWYICCCRYFRVVVMVVFKTFCLPFQRTNSMVHVYAILHYTICICMCMCIYSLFQIKMCIFNDINNVCSIHIHSKQRERDTHRHILHSIHFIDTEECRIYYYYYSCTFIILIAIGFV